MCEPKLTTTPGQCPSDERGRPKGSQFVARWRHATKTLARVFQNLVRSAKLLREILVVDDGSLPPIESAELQGVVPVRVLRTGGVGPATARNVGTLAVATDVVVFTDDDTIAGPGWVAAAVSRLREHPEEVAVDLDRAVGLDRLVV